MDEADLIPQDDIDLDELPPPPSDSIIRLRASFLKFY